MPPLDVKGFVLSGIGLSGLAFGFTTIGQGLFHPALVAGLLIAGIVGCWLYVLHARTAPAPLLDLKLLQVDTFYASVVGGFLYRIGVGATPFLLPLMLQLGFGMTPFQSGMLTFATALGAIAMKTTAGPILRRFGFKQVLVVNAFVSAAFIGATALFTEATPQAVILTVLLVGGFFKSLQFTSINSLAYADIEPRAMSRATSFASVAQQLSMSAGVAVGALVLEFQRHGRGHADVVPEDFAIAFIVVAAISALSAFVFLRLPRTAGASLSRPARGLATPQEEISQA
jgi:MFS family permease